MKLTKDQRHTAYIIMLAEFETGCELFLCNAIKRLFEISVFNLDVFEESFPEMFAHKPKNIVSSTWRPWFGDSIEGKSKRIEIIKSCIKETYNF